MDLTKVWHIPGAVRAHDSARVDLGQRHAPAGAVFDGRVARLIIDRCLHHQARADVSRAKRQGPRHEPVFVNEEMLDEDFDLLEGAVDGTRPGLEAELLIVRATHDSGRG
jgi:hypothetical protein